MRDRIIDLWGGKRVLSTKTMLIFISNCVLGQHLKYKPLHPIVEAVIYGMKINFLRTSLFVNLLDGWSKLLNITIHEFTTSI